MEVGVLLPGSWLGGTAYHSLNGGLAPAWMSMGCSAPCDCEARKQNKHNTNEPSLYNKAHFSTFQNPSKSTNKHNMFKHPDLF